MASADSEHTTTEEQNSDEVTEKQNEENEKIEKADEAKPNLSEFDKLVHDWASEKLYNGFTRESIDFSDVKVKQRPVIYHKLEEFLHIEKCFEEEFDNPGNMHIDWVYLQDFTAESHITWSIKNAFSSKYLPLQEVKLLAPPVDDDLVKLDADKVNIDALYRTAQAAAENINNDAKQEQEPEKEGGIAFSVQRSFPQRFDLRKSITVAPFAKNSASTEIRSWRLNSCKFYSEFVISGFVKIIGHKKRKNWIREETRVGVEDLFRGREHFEVIKSFQSEPEVIYKMLGECSGDVMAGCRILTQELETTV